MVGVDLVDTTGSILIGKSIRRKSNFNLNWPVVCPGTRMAKVFTISEGESWSAMPTLLLIQGSVGAFFLVVSGAIVVTSGS